MTEQHPLTMSRPDDLVEAVTAIARRRGRRSRLSDTEIDDVTQTVLTKYAVKRARGERPDNVAGFLERMTQNAIADLFRVAERKHAAPADPLGYAENGLAGLLQLERSAAYASRPAVLAQLLDEVFGLVRLEDADLVRRADLDGWSAGDLAAELGVSVAAVHQRLSRARGRLGKALAARPDLLEQLRLGHPQVYPVE